MPSIDLRIVLHAFAMASGVPPAAMQAIDVSQTAAAETAQNFRRSDPLVDTARILLLPRIYNGPVGSKGEFHRAE